MASTSCAFFSFDDLDAYTVEFLVMQSRVCVSNRVILGLACTMIILVGLSALGFFVLLARDFRLSNGWNEAKSCFVVNLGACVGMWLICFSALYGSYWMNRIGWLIAGMGVISAESITVRVWARVLVNISSAYLDSSKQFNVFNKQIQGLYYYVMLADTITLVLSAAFADFTDPYRYNLLFVIYSALNIPFLLLFAFFSYRFGGGLAKRLTDHQDTFSTMHNRLARASKGDYPSLLRRTSRRIRIIQWVIVMDKISFVASYIAIISTTFIFANDPDLGPAPYLSSYFMFCMIIPAALIIVWACAVYHYRLQRSNSARQHAIKADDTKLEAAPLNKGSDTQKEETTLVN